MTINEQDYMTDSRGALVPRSMVKEIDVLRDLLVMDIVKASEELNNVLNGFKSRTMGDIAAFIQLSAERYDVKIGGNKGNVSLFSYDGQYKVMRSINEYLVFDERLQIAKTMIDECAKEWSSESRAEVKALINYAFQVDKTGKISTDRILGLRKLDIKHPVWLKAMDAISESLQVAGSKEYVRVYKRDNAGKYQLINLDLAAI